MMKRMGPLERSGMTEKMGERNRLQHQVHNVSLQSGYNLAADPTYQGLITRPLAF